MSLSPVPPFLPFANSWFVFRHVCCNESGEMCMVILLHCYHYYFIVRHELDPFGGKVLMCPIRTYPAHAHNMLCVLHYLMHTWVISTADDVSRKVFSANAALILPQNPFYRSVKMYLIKSLTTISYWIVLP